jgi:hypothetical protein
LRNKAFSGITGTVMILALSACDNVEFEGVRIDLVPPPVVAAPAVDSAAPAAEAELPPEIVLPEGPILYMGTRNGERVSLRPVGEVVESGLRALDPDLTPGWNEAFVERDLAPGTALTLFAEGVRVGTMRVDEVETSEEYCRPTPVASGLAEFVASAGSATRFLALPEGVVAGRPYGTYRAPSHTYEQRVAGLNLASQALARTGAIWPPSVLETRADMQAIPLDGDESGAIAASFMYDDRLSVSEPESSRAYSIFVFGTGGPTQYSLQYVWYRRAADGGKAAARFFEQMDWDGDGEAEVLLEVLGTDARWAAALDRGAQGWDAIFETPCS